MKDFLFKVLKFFRQIVDSVGLGNLVIIIAVVWLLRSPLWIRVKVFLGISSEEEKESLKESHEKMFDEMYKGSDNGSRWLNNVNHDLAYEHYLEVCRRHNLISAVQYYRLLFSPNWLISEQTKDKIKYLAENKITESEYEKGGHRITSEHF